MKRQTYHSYRNWRQKDTENDHHNQFCLTEGSCCHFLSWSQPLRLNQPQHPLPTATLTGDINVKNLSTTSQAQSAHIKPEQTSYKMGGMISKQNDTETKPTKPNNHGSTSLKNKGISDEDSVLNKLKKSNKQAQNMPEDELREWARSLCIHNELKEWYLNPEFATTVEQFEKLEKVNASALNAGKKSETGMFVSTSESSEVKPSSDPNNDPFNLDDIDFDLEEIRKDAAKPFMQVGKKIKIKLIIAEICKSDTQKALRKMLSPILTKLDYQQQFGMFHSALVVGPWYLE